jgi:hypothetical protein
MERSGNGDLCQHCVRTIFRATMSKSFVQLARVNATAKPGSLIKYILRMGLYWLCATLLLWSGSHPLMEWQLTTISWFYVCSTLVVPVMGYASYWLREHDGNAEYVVSDKISHSFAMTLTQAGLLVLELFMVVITAVSVERLLF